MSNKTKEAIYTTEMIKNAKNNIEQYTWAKKMRDEAVKKADSFCVSGDEEFWWSLVTSQSVPRSHDVNKQMGSPITGTQLFEEYGNYGFELDPKENSWKIKDPTSGFWFPTNDFKAFYESGLLKNGGFEADQADRSLLKNTLYPDKGENWGVDDGTGWVDEHGYKWMFIAYYNHWLWRNHIIEALHAWTLAYQYTGETYYAQLGIILLDRIADMYPEMDISVYKTEEGFMNSHGWTGQGKILGSIWECYISKVMIRAYDAFFKMTDHPKVIHFLSRKASNLKLMNPKRCASDIQFNIEDKILREMLPAVKQAKIRGNPGMHQSTLALTAIVLDDLEVKQEILDFVFQPGKLSQQLDGSWSVSGGNISKILMDILDRDGHGDEAAPHYNALWLSNLKQIADVLRGRTENPDHDLYQNVKFKRMFTAQCSLLLLQNYTPTIGDSGKTGNPMNLLKLPLLVEAFQIYKDPIIAQLAYFLNGNSTDGIHGNIFDADPEKIAREIQHIINQIGIWSPQSANLTGYGFTALRSEQGKSDKQRALWMYYGKNSGHGHADTLNIGLCAYGMELCPDLGYPEFTGAWPKRLQWTKNTISHNTVVVDQTMQGSQRIAVPYHYVGNGPIKLVDVSAPEVYPQTSLYRRTVLMIDIDQDHSYAVDLFRVHGGNHHYYSFHAAGELVSTFDFMGVHQNTGTYAGHKVAFAEEAYEGELGYDSTHWHYPGSGFSYLQHVQLDTDPKSRFSIDWEIQDYWNVKSKNDNISNTRLNVTMLGEYTEAALADGEPPKKPGNPKKLKYLIVRRSGENIHSLFTAVIEPYQKKRQIDSIEMVSVRNQNGGRINDTSVKAIKVKLKNGRIDYVVNSLKGMEGPKVIVDELFYFKGFLGVVSFNNKAIAYLFLHDASEVYSIVPPSSLDGWLGVQSPGRLTGTIIDYTKGLQFNNEIIVKVEPGTVFFSDEEWNGLWIYVNDTAIEIQSAKSMDGNTFRLIIGETTLIQSTCDNAYRYVLKAGDFFYIPLTIEKNYVS